MTLWDKKIYVTWPSRLTFLSQPMQFSTNPYDDKTGLSYYGYRFYVPSLGRWLTRDPIGEAGGINLYGFVGNNPVIFIDANGRAWSWGQWE
jgi:RHS repeat-associated protein